MENLNTQKELSAYARLDKRLRNRELPIQFMNRDLLKYIALILMTMGHWLAILMKITKNPFILKFAIGAEFFAPPVFFFFIAEGYHHTRSKKKYALRLLLFAVITQIPHSMLSTDRTFLSAFFLEQSVIMTLFLGLMALMVIHSSMKIPLRILAAAGLIMVSWLIQAEWYIWGILLMICFDLLREKPLIRLGAFEVLMFAAMCMQVHCFPTADMFVMYFVPPMLAGVIVTFFYSGQKGHFPAFSKYFFYVWYPLHLFLLWGFKRVL